MGIGKGEERERWFLSMEMKVEKDDTPSNGINFWGGYFNGQNSGIILNFDFLKGVLEISGIQIRGFAAGKN